MTFAARLSRGPFQRSFLEAKKKKKSKWCLAYELIAVPVSTPKGFGALWQQILSLGSSQPWLLLRFSHSLSSRLLDLPFQAPVAGPCPSFGFLPAAQTHCCPFPWRRCQILWEQSASTSDSLNLSRVLAYFVQA